MNKEQVINRLSAINTKLSGVYKKNPASLTNNGVIINTNSIGHEGMKELVKYIGSFFSKKEDDKNKILQEEKDKLEEKLKKML